MLEDLGKLGAVIGAVDTHRRACVLALTDEIQTEVWALTG